METFGCQMNEYDTELVRSIMKARGFQFTSVDEEADVILFNTCAIRENAHNRLYGHLARYKAWKKERGLVIGVLGCMAQNLKQELLDTRSWIDVLVGPDAYRRLPDLLTDALEHQRQGLAVDLSEYETYAQIVPDRTGGVNGWIAVMRGCDNFCSFCVVPYTRGRERSRNPEGIWPWLMCPVFGGSDSLPHIRKIFHRPYWKRWPNIPSFVTKFICHCSRRMIAS
jgi:tRNA-2-methylthio-N6-dimethylallyladenosine synthase